MKLIRVLGYANDAPCRFAGEYVRSMDFESFKGRGVIVTTSDPKRAMHFADFRAAMEFWRRRSISTPTRPDGKPNRPMTAFHTEILDAEEA